MPPVTLLIKPASGLCNMKCSYCFYRDIGRSREQAVTGLMSEETLEALVQKALLHAEGLCTFVFQGGEPTLRGLSFFEKFVSLAGKYNVCGVKVRYALQTNGLLLNDEWARFFKRNNFLIGVSLDGPPEIHDGARRGADGKPTYALVMKHIDLLRKHGVDFNILCVVTDRSAYKAKLLYEFYRKKHFQYLQFIPCLAPLDMQGKNPPLSPEGYGEFLCGLFDLWFADIKSGKFVSVRQFDNYAAIIRGGAPESCDMGGRCSVQYAAEADGSIYPCDFFALDNYRLGNICANSFEEIDGKRKKLRFLEDSVITGGECPSCRYYVLCRGGCRRHRMMAGDGCLTDDAPRNYFCRSFTMFFDRCIGRLIRAAQGFRSPC